MNDESVRTDELSAHGPRIESDHSEIPRLHDIDPKKLGTGELLQEVAEQVGLLAQKQVRLLRTEMRADMEREILSLKALAAAGACALLGLAMLLVAVANATSPVAAAVLMGVILLVGAGVLGWIGWSQHVRRPLENSRETLREDVRWAKHRFT